MKQIASKNPLILVGYSIVVLFIILGVGVLIAAGFDQTGVVSASGSNIFLLNNGTSGTLSQTPTNVTVTANNQTWLNFSDGNFINISQQSPDVVPQVITFSAFIRLNNDETTFTQVAAKKQAFNGNLKGYMFWLDFRQANSICIRLNNGTTAGDETLCNTGNTSTVFYDNQWHHVVWQLNQSSGIYQGGFFIDGRYNGTQAGTITGAVNDSTRPFRIGMSEDGGSFSTNMSIEEIRVYNRSLSLTEITQINNSGTQVNNSLTSTGLILWLSLNENKGNTTYDKSIYRSNGTNSGAAYQNDGITITLTNSSYTVSSTTFTLTDIAYAWKQLNVGYTYATQGVTAGAATYVMTQGVNNAPLFVTLVVSVLILAAFLTRSSKMKRQ